MPTPLEVLLGVMNRRWAAGDEDAAVALANKFARIAWRLMVSGGVYNRPPAAMPT